MKRREYIGKTGNKVSRQATHFTIRYKEMEYGIGLEHIPKDSVLARGKYDGYPFIIYNYKGLFPFIALFITKDKSHVLRRVQDRTEGNSSFPNFTSDYTIDNVSIHSGYLSGGHVRVPHTVIRNDGFWYIIDYGSWISGDYNFEQLLDVIGKTPTFDSKLLREIEDNHPENILYMGNPLRKWTLEDLIDDIKRTINEIELAKDK